jgi:magnesium chelatase family protein
VRQYAARLSGPLLDRIDLRIDVPRVAPRDRRDPSPAEASAEVRARVVLAREAQLRRLRGTGAYANAHMAPRDVRRLCVVDRDGIALLDQAYDRLRLSARACDRVVKVAQTIADLAGAQTIVVGHIAESLSYRTRSAVEL